MYPKIPCVCGRKLGSNVFRQHARKCPPMLRTWQRNGKRMDLLDERSQAQKARDPIPTLWTRGM